MKRRGFTLIELIVVIAIIAVLAALLLPLIMSQYNSGSKKTAAYKCVKTYVTADQKRVDLKPQMGGATETFRCDDYFGIRNSTTMYAQFEAGKWYSVSTVGERDEFWSRFPYVTSVSEIPDPTQ